MKVQKYEISRTIDKLKSIVQKNDQFPEEKKPAVFEMNEDQLNIRIADRLTDYQEEVKLQDPLPEPLKIGFDSKLVLETLKAFTCENIAMNFSGSKMPAVVEAEDSDMKAIVLPVMIREE